MPPIRLPSTHGRALLNELSQSDVDLPKVLGFIAQDPSAGKAVKQDSGENAFHLVLGSRKGIDWIMTVLNALIAVCPEGLRRKTTADGNLPLHIYLDQRAVHSTVIDAVLAASPESASTRNAHGLVPLFLAVMRDDSQAAVVKALCRHYPGGAAELTSSACTPLHFAVNRKHPNLEVMRILLRRHKETASAVNSYGQLPLHCLCTSSVDARAAALLLDAYPAAASTADRQGRLPLHLSVLLTAKLHTQHLVAAEAEAADAAGGGHDEDNDSSDDEQQPSRGDVFHEHDPHARDLLRLLIQQHPAALTVRNHFLATPVDTVLEQTRPTASKKKVVQVYGLYDDPLTARLLLLAQRRHSLGVFKPSQLRALQELNWLARRHALWASLQGEPLTARAEGSKRKGQGQRPAGRQQAEGITIAKSNLLARLRQRGQTDLLRAAILWI